MMNRHITLFLLSILLSGATYYVGAEWYGLELHTILYICSIVWLLCTGLSMIWYDPRLFIKKDEESIVNIIPESYGSVLYVKDSNVEAVYGDKKDKIEMIVFCENGMYVVTKKNQYLHDYKNCIISYGHDVLGITDKTLSYLRLNIHDATLFKHVHFVKK